MCQSQVLGNLERSYRACTVQAFSMCTWNYWSVALRQLLVEDGDEAE